MKRLNDIQEAKKLIKLAIYAGSLQIKNGAEIYRAEDTVIRICKSAVNVTKAETHVLPSGIFVSLEFDEEIITVYKSIGAVSTNINKIHEINTFSRDFVLDKISIDSAFKILNQIENEEEISHYKFDIYAGFCGAFFAVLFGGNYSDFLTAFIVTFISSEILHRIEKFKLNFVVTHFIGAFSICLLTILLDLVHIPQSSNSVIIGSIMILVPGIAITNAVRDIMNSDFLSGLIGMTKAVFIALSIAMGVGVVLKFMR